INAGSSIPRHCFTFVARKRPCLTVTRPWAGGVTRRRAGRGPAVQSLRIVVKIPALMFVSGLPFTCLSTVGACANASVDKASRQQTEANVGDLIATHSGRLGTLIGTNRTRTKAPCGFCLVGKN